MGWLYYHRPKGETDREHFQREVLGERYRIVECATVNNVFYAAVEALEGGYPREGVVTAFVALINRNGGDPHNFGYKDMDETCGPGDAEAPAKVLDALTPVEEAYGPVDEHVPEFGANWAIQWRARCRRNLAKAAGRPKVRKGDTVKLAKPFTFADDVEADTFRLENGKRNYWTRLRDGRTVRLPKRARWPEYEVLA